MIHAAVDDHADAHHADNESPEPLEHSVIHADAIRFVNQIDAPELLFLERARGDPARRDQT